MKRPRQNEVIVCRHLQQTRLEFALVDQPAGFIDDDKGEDGPGTIRSGSHGDMGRCT